MSISMYVNVVMFCSCCLPRRPWARYMLLLLLFTTQTMGSLHGKIRQVNVRIIQHSSHAMPLEVKGSRLSPKSKRHRNHKIVNDVTNNNHETNHVQRERRTQTKYDDARSIEDWVEDVTNKRSKQNSSRKLSMMISNTVNIRCLHGLA